MGTNYYWQPKQELCECCKRPLEGQPESLHIGKSSGGWDFSMRIYPELGINNISDWVGKWLEPGSKIYNEYEDEETLEDMLRCVMLRKRGRPIEDKPYGYDSWAEFHLQNQSMLSHSGLLRPLLSTHCHSYGEGSWVYINRDFS
jgi:hypothetical protein